jgi:nucleotide-binding universal stress UspA family protein
VSLLHRLIVPTALDPASRVALRYAVEIGRATGSELSVLHVAPSKSSGLRSLLGRGGRGGGNAPDTEEADERLLAQVERFVRSVPHTSELRVRLVLRRGSPEQEVAACAEEDRADLIIVGVNRPVASLAQQLAGRSLVEHLLRHPPCPVMVVREEAETVTAALPFASLMPA